MLDAKGDPIGALGAGEAVWHTDMSYLDTPPDASMLYSLEIPPTGGNTWFCGMQAACEALPAELRRRIEGRRIKHDGTYNSGGYLRKGVTPTDDPMAAPGAWHPAILRHPANGRATLYFGRRRNSYVEGYSRERVRRAARGTVGACHAAALHLRACLEAGRPRDVGQPLDHASPRSVRRHGAAHHASHADQGNDQARGLRGLNATNKIGGNMRRQKKFYAWGYADEDLTPEEIKPWEAEIAQRYGLNGFDVTPPPKPEEITLRAPRVGRARWR